MLNIGGGEIAVILVVALLVLGPQRLPELARAIGKFMRELRRQTDEVRSTLEAEFYKMDQNLSLDEPKEAPRPIAPIGRHDEQHRVIPAISGPLDGGRRPADELGLTPNAPAPAPSDSHAAEAPATETPSPAAVVQTAHAGEVAAASPQAAIMPAAAPVPATKDGTP